MLDCSKCGKRNTLDSRFCRGCGQAMTAEDLDTAKAEVDQLLADGRKLLTDNRVTEALLLAETALESDPSSAAAFALKGDCFERLGRQERALECFEKALVLDPAAALEKIKVDHLKRVIAVDTPNAGETDVPAWRSWGAAVAAVVLVASVGAVVVLNTGNANAETKKNSNSGVVMPAVDPFPSHPADSTDLNSADNTTTSPAEETPADAAKSPEADPKTDKPAEPKKPVQPKAKTPPTQSEPEGMNPARPEDEVDPNRVASTKAPLPPAIAASGSEPDAGFRPLSPGNARISIMHEPGSDQAKDPQKQPEKQPEKAQPPKKGPADADPTPKKEEPKPFNPGIIDIRPSKDNSRTVGGSETVKDGSTTSIRPSPQKDLNAGITGAKALMKVAQQHMLTRNFAAAADAYEKALKAGASPLTVYQRLGQCYQELGRRADAISAYGKAVKTMESAAIGNPAIAERLQVSIDACKKAIRVLGG